MIAFVDLGTSQSILQRGGAWMASKTIFFKATYHSFLRGFLLAMACFLWMGLGACREKDACSKQEDCVAGTYCVEYYCKVLRCPTDRPHLCAPRCTNLKTDTNNCGSCGKSCGFGEICVDSQCRTRTEGCTENSIICDGICVDPLTDVENCGHCKGRCGLSQACKEGKCVLDCGTLSLCGSACVDLQSDRNNCGACETSCPKTELCKLGYCKNICDAQTTLCGQECINLDINKTHCGACNRGCLEKEACHGGRCICEEGARRVCYDGPTETKGLGLCQEGFSTCTNGVWSDCVGQVIPVTEVQGDSKDNDCDGKTDEKPSRQIKTWIGGEGLLQTPSGLAFNEDEKVLYVSSLGTHRIYKLDLTGRMKLFVGGTTSGKTNGSLANVKLSAPAGLALDKLGNLYVAEYGNHCIRKITSAGFATFLAGCAGIGSKDGKGTQAYLYEPFFLSSAPDGSLYLTQSSAANPPDAYMLRKISITDGTVQTIATFQAGLKNGSLNEAKFQFLRGITFSQDGEYLIAADSGNDILRKITFADGKVATLAGSGVKGLLDGVAFAASFSSPQNVLLDGNGDLYVSDTGNHAIRKVAQDGRTVTLAGGKRGWKDGIGSDAQFSNPAQLTQDRSGNLYVADSANNAIRKISTDGTTSTIYREITNSSHEKLLRPGSIAFDSLGRLFIPDIDTHGIFAVNAQGDLIEWSGHNGSGHTDGTTNVNYNAPTALAFDARDNLFVADEGNNCIRKVDANQATTTYAGTTTAGFVDGPLDKARFSAPSSLAFDKAGNLYIADKNNHSIRKIDTSGNVTTIAGDGIFGTQDGQGKKARFHSPNAITLDTQGNIYVADTGNHSIRKIDAAGNVTTIAGDGQAGSRNGAGKQARFNGPCGILWLPTGEILVADTQNLVIRQIDAAGNVTRFAGNGGKNEANGPVEQTGFKDPYGLALDKQGRIFISDRQGAKIRIIE